MSVIDETLNVLFEMTAQSRELFSGVPVEVLNWKPTPDRWSAAQCLDHLIAAHSAYIPIFEQLQRGEYQTRAWERLPLLPMLFGKSLVIGMSNEKNKLIAPKIFQPTHSNLLAAIVPLLLANHERLIEHISKLREEDLDRVITSPVSRWVTYTLRDTCRIIAAHEILHFHQAKTVLELQ